MTESPRPVIGQLLAGRDFAVSDAFAAQMVNFVYVLGDRSTGEAVIVDPAYAPAELLAILAANNLRLTGAVLTHYHADHAGGAIFDRRIAGIAELLEEIDVPVHIQAAELDWVMRTTEVGAASFVGHASGDLLAVGGVEVTLVHTPGHTPGSQCLFIDGHLVTGDTLFIDGCGRTDLPGGDGDALYESIVQTIGSLPDDTIVLPGHDYSTRPSAALATLRRTNPVLVPQARSQWIHAFTS